MPEMETYKAGMQGPASYHFSVQDILLDMVCSTPSKKNHLATSVLLSWTGHMHHS